MCGIVGLFLKDKALEKDLGAMLTTMLITMSDRGPDSAGIAVYGEENQNSVKLTVQSANPESDFCDLQKHLSDNVSNSVKVSINDTHALLQCASDHEVAIRQYLSEHCPSIRVMSSGETMEIYKEVGLPENVADRFNLRAMSGTHGIGHTRMATESEVNTLGAHPFSTGRDQCLVHNGSLSNHNNLRRLLKKQGISVSTENDTEVAAAYLSWKLQLDYSLDEALTSALDDLDGFFTFVVGTKDGFGVLRDPIACKPAVLAETDQYVAFGSEYRALVDLPNIEKAKVWEPEPATVYFWKH